MSRANIVEEMEIRLRRILKSEMVPDFTGAGRRRGGPGVHSEAVNAGSAGQMATGSSDGDVVQRFGACGALPSPVCRTYLRRNGEDILVKPHRMVEIETGDILVKHSSGGGAAPAERAPEMVREDVENELVSLQAARDVYKVAIDPISLEVDLEATETLRAQGKR